MARKTRYPEHSPQRIDSIIKTFKNLGIEAKVRENAVRKLWPEAVGSVIAKKATPQKLMGKTLYVAVSTSAWMTELNYSKRLIIEKLNQKLGGEVVSEIVLKPGSVPEPSGKNRTEETGKRTLTREEEEFIKETTSPIKDAAIKSLIKRVLEKGKKAGSF